LRAPQPFRCPIERRHFCSNSHSHNFNLSDKF
jgi:hypothetical protein